MEEKTVRLANTCFRAASVDFREHG